MSSKQDKIILAIGGDSTNVNTGWKGGAIHLLEVGLNRRLVWIVCYLHLNELPLRHLIIKLDGKTSSNNTFSGDLGKSLQQVEDLEYNPNFKPVKLGPGLPDLAQDVVDDLSDDQQYGFNMVMGIRKGSVPLKILMLSIGPVSHARWLTTANRFLKLWVSDHGFDGDNLKNLEMIVEFIVTVYYPVWFQCKVKHHVSLGPNQLLMQVHLVIEHMRTEVMGGMHTLNTLTFCCV